ncbi:MAG: leucyl aminopeptidase [Thermomicrobiales bacterium]|nr:leucyl aminopeptidase [Thermomicrobiales bacterium]
MQFGIESGKPLETASDALIVPVEAGDIAGIPAALGGMLPETLAASIAEVIADARFTGKAGNTLVVPMLGAVPVKRLALTGLGPADELTAGKIERAYGAAARAARDAGARRLTAIAPPAPLDPRAANPIEAAVIGMSLGLYAFTTHFGAGQPSEERSRVESVAFVGPGSDTAQDIIARGVTIAQAVNFARDLVNEPASTLTPERMAEHARDVAAEANLEVEVLGPDELARLGAGAITAVGQGSANPPRMIRLRYTPDGADAEPERIVGLVGKCITFDTGGYSIKPADAMMEMKGDMAGGAAVLAAMSALSSLDCAYPVEATICAAENMISGKAFRPGDILTAMNGVTIEVLNTDAEGRLVMADGLVDTARRGATELIDLATLTGAIIVALGEGTTGLFSDDDRLANALLTAAEEAGERMWRMPLVEELNEKIRGDVGDVKNIGGRPGGAVTAALFLQRFTEGRPWAHFDIAGSSSYPAANALGPKGASGEGVRTLLAYLCGA